MKKMLLTAAMLAFISTAHAQVVIQSPDIDLFTQSHVESGHIRHSGTKAHLHNPCTVVVIQSPGHRPVYAIPRGNGTYVIPGQRPTYITPR